MIPGEFDIGNWMRDFHIEYLVPMETTSWNYKKGESFFYLELMTNRKIIFKKFDINDSKKIVEIATECVHSSSVNFDKPYGMKKRYKHFNTNGYKKQILSELQKITNR